jgi:adenylate cyclase class 2
MLEIERKAWVHDPGAARQRLERVAALASEDLKEDRYYLLGWRPGRPIDFAADPVFRVRISGGRAVIGWKARSFVGSTEVNEESEIDVGDPGPVLAWLGYLGLEPFVVKRKHSRAYRIPGRLSDARVELNHVEGLGHFLEVEVLADRDGMQGALATIDGVFEMLGVDRADVEPRYYIDLLMHGPGTR